MTPSTPAIDTATLSQYRQQAAQERQVLEAKQRTLKRQLADVEKQMLYKDGQLSILKQLKADLERQPRIQRQTRARDLRAREWLRTVRQMLVIVLCRR